MRVMRRRSPTIARSFGLWITCFFLLSEPANGQRTSTADPQPLARFGDSLTDMPTHPTVVRARTFISGYSSVLAHQRSRLDLSITLAIHNTSDKGILVIEGIDYFNAAGEIVMRYLPQPAAIKPYASIQILTAQDDLRGGLGGNFIVDWSSPSQISEPVIEAVMIGIHGTHSYGFLSSGRRIDRP